MIVLDWFGVLALRREAIARFVTRRAMGYAGILAAVSVVIQMGYTQESSRAQAHAELESQAHAFFALLIAAYLVGIFFGRRRERAPRASQGVLACAVVTVPLGLLLRVGVPYPYAEGAVVAYGVRDAITWTWRALVVARAIVVLEGVRGLVAWTCLLAPASATYGVLTFYAHYSETRGVFGPRSSREAEHLAFGYGAAIVFALVIPIAIGMATAVHIMLRDDPVPPGPASAPPEATETACAPEESR